MTSKQYATLMDALDAAREDIEDLEELSPEAIYVEIIDALDRSFEDVPTEEIDRVIKTWQKRRG